MGCGGEVLLSQHGERAQLLVSLGAWGSGEHEQRLRLVLGEQHLTVQFDRAEFGVNERFDGEDRRTRAPAVRTALLPGQENSEFAMPLEEFVAEVMELLETRPDATEIQVERVKFLRYGEARGDYDQVVATLNASDPHGR
jgi:hypothetical protein